jgi:hypothetical protein
MSSTPDKSEAYQKEIARACRRLAEGTIDQQQCERACCQAYTRCNGPVAAGDELVVRFQKNKAVVELVSKRAHP